MSCDAVAVRPARHRPWAASVLASAGLCALVAVLMSGPAPQFGAGITDQASGTQASALVSAQVLGDDPPPVQAGPGEAGVMKKGVPFRGTAAVGALFSRVHGKLGGHFCTASVLHSPQGNLLITAAHCITGRRLTPAGSMEFAPGFAAGKFPYGLWPVTAAYVDSRWSSDQNPNDDVAFLVVKRPGKRIEKYTGAETLAVNRKPPQLVQVIGYPDTTNRPITCTAPARPYDPGTLRQLVFDCDDYTNGTSGGPFLTNVSRRTGGGSVVGVIGGYQEGGYSPDVSYSPKFLDSVRDLYKVATARHS
jgi:V8-like Glu-specific endopeptidase